MGMDGLEAYVFAHNTPRVGSTIIDKNKVRYWSQDIGDIPEYSSQGRVLYNKTSGDCRELLLDDITSFLHTFATFYHFYHYQTIHIIVPAKVEKYARPYLDYIYEKLNITLRFTWEYSEYTTTFTIPSTSFTVPLGSCIMYFAMYTYSLFRHMNYHGKIDYPVTDGSLLNLLGRICRNDPYDGPFTVYPIWYITTYDPDIAWMPYDNTYGNSTTGVATYVQYLLRRGTHVTLFNRFLNQYNINRIPFGDWLNKILTLEENTAQTGGHYD